VVKNLYVGNLSWDATEDDVKNYFGDIGEVRSVNIIKDRETGKPRGFCFLEMENGDQAIEELNGSEMMGRKLLVNEARPRGEKRENYHSTEDNGRYQDRSYRR
jgi:RNA recognition motif-containing protein